jgi:hypothetical protein
MKDDFFCRLADLAAAPTPFGFDIAIIDENMAASDSICPAMYSTLMPGGASLLADTVVVGEAEKRLRSAAKMLMPFHMERE